MGTRMALFSTFLTTFWAIFGPHFGTPLPLKRRQKGLQKWLQKWPKNGSKKCHFGTLFGPFLTGTWPGPWAKLGVFGQGAEKRGVRK